MPDPHNSLAAALALAEALRERHFTSPAGSTMRRSEIAVIVLAKALDDAMKSLAECRRALAKYQVQP